MFIITHIIYYNISIILLCSVITALCPDILLNESPNNRNGFTSHAGTFVITTMKCNKQMDFDEHIRSKEMDNN